MNKRPKQTAATRAKIMAAYMEIAKEKGTQNTTVRNVTQKAGINRSTFYEYFIDVYDLLDQYENTLLENAHQELAELELSLLGKSDDSYNPLTALSGITVNVINSFGDDVFFLMGRQGDPAFREKLTDFLLPLLKEFFIPDESDIPHADYVLAFTISAINGTLTHWHQTGHTISDTEVVTLIETILNSGLGSYCR